MLRSQVKYVTVLFAIYYLYTLSNSLDHRPEIIWAVLLIIILYFLSVFQFLKAIQKNKKPKLQDWLSTSIFFFVVVDFMGIVNDFPFDGSVLLYGHYIDLSHSPYILIVILVSFVALNLSSVPFKFIKDDYNGNNILYFVEKKNIIFALLVLVTFCKGLLLITGYMGYGTDEAYSGGVFSLVNQIVKILTPFVLAFSGYILFVEKYESLKYKTLYVVVITVQVILGLLSGMKEEVLIPILFFLIPFLVGGGRLKLQYIGALVLLLVLLYPLNNIYREISNTQPSGSKVAIVQLAIEQFSGSPFMESFDEGLESYSERTSLYVFLHNSINIEPQWTDYKNMERYLYLPVSWWIPRIVLPNKPRADIGIEYYEILTGVDGSTSITPSSIGWAYLEGGIIFVFVIFFLMGLFLNQVDRLSLENPINLTFYIIVFQKCLKPEWDPYFFFTGLVQVLVIFVSLNFIIKTKKFGIKKR